MDYKKFLKAKYEYRAEFIEIQGLYEFCDISEGLKTFLAMPEFCESKTIKAFEAEGYHPLGALKRIAEKGTAPKSWEYPVDEVLALKAGVEIRGLSGDEYQKISGKSSEELHEIALGLLASVSQGRADAVKKFLNFSDSGKRFLFFEAGLLWPEIGVDKKIEMASKLNRIFPIDFIRITNRIVELTGFGQCPEGSQGRSSATRK